LPEVGELLHLRAREVRAPADGVPVMAVEFRGAPAAETVTEDAALARDLAHRVLVVGHLDQLFAQTGDRLLAGPDGRLARPGFVGLTHAAGPEWLPRGRSAGTWGASTTRSGN